MTLQVTLSLRLEEPLDKAAKDSTAVSPTRNLRRQAVLRRPGDSVGAARISSYHTLLAAAPLPTCSAARRSSLGPGALPRPGLSRRPSQAVDSLGASPEIIFGFDAT